MLIERSPKERRAPRPQLHLGDVFLRRAGKPLNQPRRKNEGAPVLEVDYYPMSGPVVANAFGLQPVRFPNERNLRREVLRFIDLSHLRPAIDRFEP
jgi:hypothetical protein